MRGLGARRFALLALGLFLVAAAATIMSAFMVPEGESFDLAVALSDPESTARLQWDLLWPRILNGLLVGAVLGASGAALQGLLRNPLADPFILGVSGGAALGASAVAILGWGALMTEAVGGFVGAFLALALVTTMATRQGRLRPLDVLLIGVIFNAFAGALLMLLQSLGSSDAVHRVLLRLMGSLATDPSQPLILPVALGGLSILMVSLVWHARALNVMALGDTTAQSLGIAPDRVRGWLFFTISLAVGAVVATAGMIGFVGLVVPHVVRMIFGPDHRVLVIASALLGGAFVVLADGCVRLLSASLLTELPVGVVTALIGGPMFIWLLRRSEGEAWS
jgi:iron complex transport system permease protein